jgi:N utilization substance protein B
MTRTNAREIAVHYSFELGFSNQNAENFLKDHFNKEIFSLLAEEEHLYKEFPNEKQQNYIKTLVKGAHEHGPELDGYIEKYSVGWRFQRIDRVAASIMRIAMYEIMYMPDIPNAASINDAVEISKGYEEPEVVKFINGILGAFVRGELIEDHTVATPAASDSEAD